MSQNRYTAEYLVRNIKIRGMVPTANAAFSSSQDFLDLANDELLNQLAPDILSVRQDYYAASVDYPMPANEATELVIPPRAIGATWRNVQFIDATGTGIPVEAGRRKIEDTPYINIGFYVQDNALHIVNRFNTGYNVVRAYFYLRPNVLVTADQVAQVTAISGTSVSLSQVPAGFASGLKYDLIQADPNFSTLSFDAVGTLSGSQLSFVSLPTRLAVGDQVSLAGESNLVQLPVEFQPILAQATLVRCLEAVGDMPARTLADARLKEMIKNGMRLIANRLDSAPELCVPVWSPARAWF